MKRGPETEFFQKNSVSTGVRILARNLTLLDLPVAQDSILVLGQRGQDRILGYEGIRFEFNKVKLYKI